MELDQLRYFLKVAEEANFTRAAESLKISQPALSRSILRLEEELGRPVFERGNRQLSLTDAGSLLRTRATQILSIVDDTLAEITDDAATGTVRVGAIPTIAPYFLPQALQSFSDQFPKARVAVREATTDELVKACQQGEIDLAVLALPLPVKHLDVQPLFDEELLVVLPAEHALCKKKQIRISDMSELPFVLLDEAHCLTDSVVSFCRRGSFQPVAVERTSQLAMVQELVALSHGVSMVPEMARKLDQSDRRVYRSLSGEKPKRTVAVAWNPYRFESRLMKTLRDHLVMICKRST